MTEPTPPPATDPAAENVEAGAQPSGEAAPAPRPRRGGNWKSMLWSTLIVTAIVLVWYVMAAMPDSVPDRTVDADVQAEVAERETGRDVAQAVGLGEGWGASHTSLSPDGADRVWHVTYRTPEGKHLSIDQRILSADSDGQKSDGKAGIGPWVDSVAGTSEATGEVEIGGRTWETRLRPDPDRRSAVLAEAPDRSAVVVSGDASEAELRELVGALELGSD